MKDGNPLKKQHRRPFAFTGDDDPTSKGGFETQTLRRVDRYMLPQNRLIANQNSPHARRIENRHTLLKVLPCYENRRIRFHQTAPADRAFPIQFQAYQITQILQGIPTIRQSLTVDCTAKQTCKKSLQVRVVKESLTTEPLQGRHS
jgi:hypothetical protein